MKWKAIILASGRGSRMGELTENTSKCLLEVGGKPIIEWTMDSISRIPEFDEIIICVDWKKEQIKKRLGNRYNNTKITYVHIPHLPKEDIEKEYKKSKTKKNREDFSSDRNYLEYIEAKITCAMKNRQFNKTDFFWRFNGDVLHDHDSIKKFADLVRKNGLSLSGTIITAYSNFLIKILYQIYKKDWEKMVEFEKNLYGLALFLKNYPGELNLMEFYQKVLEYLPKCHLRRYIQKQIKNHKEELINTKAYVDKKTYNKAIKIGKHLHENNHVDTKEDLEKLRRRFS